MANDSSATKISELDNTYPDGATDTMAYVDNQLRMLKNVLDFHFSALGDTALTVTAEELNMLDGRQLSSDAEIIDNFEGESDGGGNPTMMLFRQTTAPTGWTKDTNYDENALRVVSGTVGAHAGTNFSTIFGSGKTTGAHKLTVAEMPAHTHNVVSSSSSGGSGSIPTEGSWSYYKNATITSTSTGGDGTHSHTVDLDPNYVDVIIAKKA